MRFEDVKVGQTLAWSSDHYEVLYVSSIGAVLKRLGNGKEYWQRPDDYVTAEIVKPKIKTYTYIYKYRLYKGIFESTFFDKVVACEKYKEMTLAKERDVLTWLSPMQEMEFESPTGS